MGDEVRGVRVGKIGEGEESMKEHGLMFTDDMMRAILVGRKTQTRRTVRGSKSMDECGLFPLEPDPDKCPHGIFGDQIWCREAWRAEELEDGLDGVRFRSDNSFVEIENTEAASILWMDAYSNGKHKGKWRPSIHMPRWAARIILEITDVRVHRLRDITKDDAVAEGAHWQDFGRCGSGYPLGGWSMRDPHPNHFALCLNTARFAFANYVNELADGPRWNLKPSNAWDRNPWVWAITFKRVEV